MTKIDTRCCVCGYRFEKGEEYLIYAKKIDDSYFYVSLCSRTKRIISSQTDMEILDDISSGSIKKYLSDTEYINLARHYLKIKNQSLKELKLFNNEKREFHFGYVHGFMDCRYTKRDGVEAVEFSWQGNDEFDPVFGRGFAIIKNGNLLGQLFFHEGDDSEFKAIRS
ncbi:MAG: hypothetical protein HQK76_17200 [Desulfobacterales bacterium]|nr:hypothetical protein [Desulfobacterales bacterium]